ncbi:MAG TPA: MerR family transcriptional regulator [Candidatus Limnocylindrales bacterium]|jgi:DNA-binding transcriptional MerR regulator|nr:MerR family transcriptional regulator [Candidatus Limnocylindrales bacterium]
MHSVATDEESRYRVGELARLAGVSRETIHFYLREGLLQPAEKLNARVSYFGDAHVARLRLIKAFQQAHIPLARIREQLDGLSRMGTPETPATVERAVAVVTEFLSLDGEEPSLTPAEVAERAGLAVEDIAKLEALGVLRPQVVDGERVYTAAEVEAARAARTITEQGIELEKLGFVRRYSELAEQELAYLFHHLIKPALAAGRREQVSATLANRGLSVLEAYLRRQYRRETLLFPPEMPDLPDPLAEQPPTNPPSPE